MSDSSRRGFLKVAGAGVAGVGVAAVAGGIASAEPAAIKPASVPRSAKGPIVAHVLDARTGAMSLMVEGHEVTITDRDLAARIATALHENSPRTVNSPAV